MTSMEIIEEIKRLPLDEQNRVIEFVQKTRQNRPASPEQLGQLTRRMVEEKDPEEADRIKKEVVRGFYDGQSHALRRPTASTILAEGIALGSTP